VHAHSRQAARVQCTILIVAAFAVGLMVMLRLQRPFDRDTLAIQVSQLQSHAAEAAVLSDNVRAGRLAPGFVRQHAQQLADKVDSVDGKLQSKPAQRGLAGDRINAQRLGASLQAALHVLASDADRPRRQELGFGALARQLDGLHRQLKPGG
jgi:hypothetical protein